MKTTFWTSWVQWALGGAMFLAACFLGFSRAESDAASVKNAALGRLFFTPEQRQALDRQRRENRQEQDGMEDAPTLTIDGVVIKSDGKATVWINGRSHDTARDGASVSASANHPAEVAIKTDAYPERRAKVGDTLKR